VRTRLARGKPHHNLRRRKEQEASYFEQHIIALSNAGDLPAISEMVN
jgi:hypothetical protein